MKMFNIYILMLLAAHTISAHFFLLDGRSPSHGNPQYTLGDSYYYSKLLCTSDFVNTIELRNSTTQTLTNPKTKMH